MRAVNPSRVVAAIAVLALAAGTALAASPSPEPSASAAVSQGGASASASVAASSVPESAAPSKAAPTPTPAKASEAPETETPETETLEAPPTAAEAADIVARLKAAGISTTAVAFQSLAAKVGTGGAVRTLAFAQASGQTPAQIVALREGGKGWGQIKKELGLKIGPGIGWIMSGGRGKGHSK